MAFAYTLGTLVTDTLQRLRGATREIVNILAVGIDAPAAGTVETVTLTTNVEGIHTGSLLVVGDETMYVQSVNPQLVTATVIRGYDGTTTATAASGTIVYIDPPWTRALVMATIRDEIRSWAPQIFKTAYVEIPLVNWQRGYDLGAITVPIIRILKVTAPEPPYIGTPGDWTGEGVTDTAQLNPTLQFKYDPNANIVEFTSGRAVILTGGWTPRAIGNLHVVYATPFDVDTSWTDSTDMIASVGLNEMDLDIPVLGAAARLLRYIAPRRAMLNAAGQVADTQAVTMTTILQAATEFDNQRQKRLNDAQQRVLSDFPYRSSNY